MTERSVTALQSDLTSAARIRDAAMRLFVEHGIAGTRVRAVAEEASVSAGLVIHHFGSKAGLRRAVDEWVVTRFLAALRAAPLDADGDALVAKAEQVTLMLRTEPLVCDYLARALSEGGDASDELFARVLVAASNDAVLVETGVLRSEADCFWRAVQPVMLIVGPLLLRGPIERRLGGSLLDEDNLKRWMDANVDLLRNGLYPGPEKGTR